MITISAVFDPLHGQTMTLPVHCSLCCRPCQGGHVKIKNFDIRDTSMPPTVGNLEDARRTQDERAHFARTTAIGVGGVVALHCPVHFAKEFIFGDPVYVTSNPIFRMTFNDITILVPSNTVTGAPYCKVGTFVEQIDAQRGGIRLKLDIGEWSSDASKRVPPPPPLVLPGAPPAPHQLRRRRLNWRATKTILKRTV